MAGNEAGSSTFGAKVALSGGHALISAKAKIIGNNTYEEAVSIRSVVTTSSQQWNSLDNISLSEDYA